eukprot:68893-Prymnesium_polylepis.1
MVRCTALRWIVQGPGAGLHRSPQTTPAPPAPGGGARRALRTVAGVARARSGLRSPSDSPSPERPDSRSGCASLPPRRSPVAPVLSQSLASPGSRSKPQPARCAVCARQPTA